MTLQLILLYFFVFISFSMTFFYFLTYFEQKKGAKYRFKEYPKVSFVIPAYNAGKTIGDSVKSIFSSNYPKGKIEVIVVNDGSTDNTLETLKALAKTYPLTILSKKNQGRKVFALNYGLRKVKTDYIVVLDADTVLSRNLLRESMDQLADPRVAAVTSKMIPKNDKNLFEKMQLIEYAFTSYNREVMHAADSLQTTPAYTAFKKSFFDKYGLFDEENISEDFEMGLRVQKNHFNIAFVSDEYAITDIPRTFSALQRQRVRWGFGVFDNLARYHKLFNPKYGDFGVFFLPSMLVSIFALFGVMFLSLYSMISSTVDMIQKMMLGWRPEFFQFDMFSTILSISELKTIMAVLMFAFAFIIFMIIKKADKRIRFVDYIAYVFIYSWILAYFYILSLGRFIMKARPEW